jgi:hypothetical protein
MNKNEFLQSEDVSGFIGWLVERLPGLAIRLDFSASRFVPGGLRADVTGIEQVLRHYAWNTSWNDDGKLVQSGDWDSTRTSLQRLRRKLLDASGARDEAAMLAACLAVLEWGGVSGARSFLRRKAEKGQLVAYLGKVRAALALDADGDLDALDGTVIERFDAGLTKIHALFDTTGLPIYDSRVGAAISMLYAMHRAEKGAASRLPAASLAFPSGGARGPQVRNPNGIDERHAPAPQFYTAKVSDVWWAQNQVRLGWIVEAVLKRTDLFARDCADLPARCHAFEAALFMVGYDLRCLSERAGASPRLAADSLTPLVPPTGDATADASTNWVPAGHGFETLFARYVDYRKQLGAEGVDHDDVQGAGFAAWLHHHHGPYDEATLRTYRYPFRQSEFDLFGRSLDELLALRQSIETGDAEGVLRFLSDFDVQSDERRNVCLIDAWCVGYLAGKGLDRSASIAALVAAGFAGTDKAAATLFAVGSNVGRCLNLLDNRKLPTALFERYFGAGPEDLAARLNRFI